MQPVLCQKMRSWKAAGFEKTINITKTTQTVQESPAETLATRGLVIKRKKNDPNILESKTKSLTERKTERIWYNNDDYLEKKKSN